MDKTYPQSNVSLYDRISFMADEEKELTPPDLPVAEAVKEPEPEVSITTGVGPLPTAPAGGPTSPQPDFFAPETFGPSPMPEGISGGNKILKTILIAVAVVLLVGGVGVFSYFVIFPIVFSPKVPTTVQKPPLQLSAHKSFLAVPPSAEAEVKLSDRRYQTIATALQNESFNQLADKQFKEVKIFDNQGQVPFPAYLAALAPAASAVGGDWLENDFTALFYYNGNGVWPVYVAKLKAGVDPSIVLSGMKTLESIIDLNNFYLTPPGTFQPFKDGKAGKYSTRYSVGTQAGAAFNYAVAGNYLLLSTNYDGLKGVLPLLGL